MKDDEMNKKEGIAPVDQSRMATAHALGSFYRELIEEGFSMEQAFDFVDRMFDQWRGMDSFRLVLKAPE